MDLEAYFRINFAMMQFHKYSLTENRKYDSMGKRYLRWNVTATYRR